MSLYINNIYICAWFKDGNAKVRLATTSLHVFTCL